MLVALIDILTIYVTTMIANARYVNMLPIVALPADKWHAVGACGQVRLYIRPDGRFNSVTHHN